LGYCATKYFVVFSSFLSVFLPPFLSFSFVSTSSGSFQFPDYRRQTDSGTLSTSHSVGTDGSFPTRKAAKNVKLTTRINLVAKLRIRGAIPTLLPTPLRRGDELGSKKTLNLLHKINTIETQYNRRKLHDKS
jgi:hypothetical protein